MTEEKSEKPKIMRNKRSVREKKTQTKNKKRSMAYKVWYKVYCSSNNGRRRATTTSVVLTGIDRCSRGTTSFEVL